MADFNIQPLGAQIRPVQPMSLADMVNLARGVQAYQQATQINPIELQTAQQQLSRLQQLTPEEVTRARAEALVAQQTTQPRISSAESAAQTARAGAETAQIGTQEAQLRLTRQYLGMTRSEASDLLKQPSITYDDIESKFKKILDSSGIDDKTKSTVLSQGLAGIPKGLTTDQYRAILAQQLVKTVGAENQLSTLFPSIQMLGTGQAAIPITTGSALAVQQPGMPTGVPGIPMQPPPTTEQVLPTGERRMIGTLPTAGTTAPAPQLQTGLTPGQEQLLKGGAATLGQDVQTTVNEASQAPQRISIFQNIKKLSPEAFTGVGGARKEMAAGILNAIGIPAYEQEKVSSEELRKNSALLALAGGNTDAARALAELAVPNTKLNEKAVRDIADQLIGVEKMKVARANFLTPVMNDAAQYQQRQLQFNQIADSRLFEEATPDKVKKAFDAMSPREREEMLGKIRLAKQLGILK